jgi:2-methylcitrate dehydratase PrpD
MTGAADFAGRLGAWAASLDAVGLPAGVAAAATRCIVDATGVGLAARGRAVVEAALDVARRSAAAGPCTLIGRPEALSAVGAAQVNATAIHALDFDDTSYAGTLHATAVVWPAVLAAAEQDAASGADAFAGLVAGVETAYALGRAMGNAIYDRGWWTTALFGTIGAAAGSARALRMDRRSTRHAIALAAAQAFGMRAVMGSAAKPFLCGRAAANGLTAALAAGAGIDGPAAALESGFGLAGLAGAGGADWGAVDELGARFALVDPGIAFKQYPVCSSSQAAAEATAAILAGAALDGEAVARVDCLVTPMVAQCLPYPQPRSVAEAQFSLPFAVGCILAFGALAPGHLSDAVLADPRLLRAMAKVSMAVDPTLAATAEDRRDRPEASIVTVAAADGRRFTRRVDAATGMPANPMSDTMLEAKFRSCARSALSAHEADALLQRLRGLRNLASIRALFVPPCEEFHAQASVQP